MRLRKPLLAQVLLFVSLLGALEAFDYEQLLQLSELSRVCALALFLWLALSTRFDSRWALYVFLPALCLALFVLLYAYVFTLRTGNPLLPSILAQRSYVYFLLGPVVYMLYMRGWKLIDFQRVFLSAIFLTTASLVAYDLVFAPRSLLLSGTFFEVGLGTVSDQTSTIRGISTSAMFLVLYFGRRLFQTGDALFLGFALTTVAISTLLLAISLIRGTLASVGIALILYAVCLSRPERAKLAVIMLPLYVSFIVISLSPFGNAFIDWFRQDRTGAVRVETAETAWQVFLEYPLFGFGQDSVQSESYQDLFPQSVGQFYPADIGLLGVAFQFGLVGLALYLFLSGWLCINLLKLLWYYAGKMDPKQRAFLWALFVVCLSFFLASPLQGKFVYSTGLPIGAFAWGLLMAHAHGRARSRPSPGRGPAKIPEMEIGHR